jgi:sarcosine oxidase
MKNFDCIVIGTGGVGSAALYHAARRGLRVAGLDRFPPGHDRGSSHGQTRIIRQAYFEHPDYVPLVLRAYRLWEDLSASCGEQLYHATGLVQFGPPEGVVLPGVMASARQHGLVVERLSGAEAMARWPAFRVPPGLEAVYEPQAGYLLVERCVQAHAASAVGLGAELYTGAAVRGWQADAQGVCVQTDAESFAARSLIVTAGAWAGQLLAELKLRLEVRRKAMYWFRAEGPLYAAARMPCYLYELPRGVFYGMPRIDHRGIKAAEHSGGLPVTDPLGVDRAIDPCDLARVQAMISECLPGAAAQPSDHSVCLYTMSADEHFIVDCHPEYPHVAFAAGLSGHGFKFACVLGEALVALVCGEPKPAELAFLGLQRAGIRAAC